MLPIVNIAAYQFVSLSDLDRLRPELLAVCQEQGLRGTILLSPEGINLFLAGSREGIDAFLQHVRGIPGLEGLPVKESYSEKIPFNRMLVKIKAEIIAFGVAGIEPGHYTSRRISPHDLKQWLDEGRPVTLLDTRNRFEVRTGTFQNAIEIQVDDFRHFPEAVEQLPEELKQQPVVTFCTGGIRCEKAAPFLERAGFQDVYQLDGGILKYFEECGGAHYNGDCFVFDQRVALNPELKQCDWAQCYACQSVLSVEEQQSPLYRPGLSCPNCYESTEAAQQKLLAKRLTTWREVVNPLPGSQSYENIRPINIPLRLDGCELLAALEALKTHVTRTAWEEIIRDGRLTCRGEVVQPGRIVRAGEQLEHHVPGTTEPDVSVDLSFLYEDQWLVVVHKPAPLPMHPCGRFHRNTLTELLNLVYAPAKLRPAHRLDADTSGVVVLSRSREIARLVQPQFEKGQVRKRYLARVHGCPPNAQFECHHPLQATPGELGVRLPDETGVAASTRFQVIGTFSDQTTLLDVEPLTGRTNQIRAHLWHLGFPIQGDPIYLPDGQIGRSQALPLTAAPMCLHAETLELTHPMTQQRVTFQGKRPSWAEIS